MTGAATGKLAIDGGTPVRADFLPISRPMLGETEKRLVLETLESGWITTGERALELGRRVAALAGARHGLAVNSATGALHLALAALNVRPGDEVITSPYTFAACVNVIEHVGATPVLADVEPDTLCVDPRAIEAAITPRTRVLLPVDYAGHPCAMDAIMRLAGARGLRVVEDAAHALGASWQGRPIGSFADVTAFSFYATKNLTTGEGGAAVTNDEALSEKISVLSLHGMSHDAWKRYGDAGSWFYEIVAPGFKYNLSDVLAAIGLGQLEHFADMQRLRSARAERYLAALADVPEVRVPVIRSGAHHAWHLFPIALELERLRCDRAEFARAMRAENVGTSVHFIPIHFHPHYRATLPYREGAFPVAENAYRRGLTLPLFPSMSERDVDDVVAAVRKIATALRR